MLSMIYLAFDWYQIDNTIQYKFNKYYLLYRYGQQAGQLADNTLYAAGNLAMTAYNVDSLGIKAVAKRAAKDTGKAVIQDIANSKKKGPNLMDKRMLTDDEKPLK